MLIWAADEFCGQGYINCWKRTIVFRRIVIRASNRPDAKHSKGSLPPPKRMNFPKSTEMCFHKHEINMPIKQRECELWTLISETMFNLNFLGYWIGIHFIFWHVTCWCSGGGRSCCWWWRLTGTGAGTPNWIGIHFIFWQAACWYLGGGRSCCWWWSLTGSRARTPNPGDFGPESVG